MADDTDRFSTLGDDYREALEHCKDSLQRLESNPEDREALKSASQQLHHIKAFARPLGDPKLRQLAHILEGLLEAVNAKRFPFDEGLAALLFKGMDVFVHYLRTREVVADKAAEITAEAEPLLLTVVEEENARKDMEPLLPDFIAAARDNVDGVNRGLSSLGKEHSHRELLQEVYRNAHSLKGSALTMGFETMGRLAHDMEEVLRALQEGQLSVTDEVVQALSEANDALSEMLDTLSGSTRMRVDVASRVKGLVNLLLWLQYEKGMGKTESVQESGEVRVVTGSRGDTALTIAAIDTVRIPTAKLDELINLASEAFMAKNRLAAEIRALSRIGGRLQMLRRQERVLPHLANTGAGSRIPPVSDLVELGKALDEASRRLQEAAEHTGRHIQKMYHRSMEIRMLPLALVFKTLPRAVRDLSRQFGKQVNLEVEGGETIIDKRILEQIGDPLIHLLRNALDHGIEPPELRRRSGKPETGTVRLQARQEGSRVFVTILDDGRGIDFHRLKEAAINKGIVGRNEIADWTAAQLLELVFLPGFSTSDLITEVSGCGVGLDVVRTNVERLEGQVEVTSELGKGTHITMSLPLTLATTHALLVQCAGEILAIPISSVAKTIQVLRGEIRPVRREHAILHQGEILPVRSLAVALGWDRQNGLSVDSERAMLVALQAGERRTGFIVDDILAEQEIVAKKLSGHLQEVPCVAGATILGTGEVALILDVPQLLWQKHGAGGMGPGVR